MVAPIEERLGIEALAIVIMNSKGDEINDYDYIVSTLGGREGFIYLCTKKFRS